MVVAPPATKVSFYLLMLSTAADAVSTTRWERKRIQNTVASASAEEEERYHVGPKTCSRIGAGARAGMVEQCGSLSMDAEHRCV